jgi:hypothetical protein
MPMVVCLEIQPCHIIKIIQFYACFTSFTFLFSSPESHYVVRPTEGLFGLVTYEILTKREADIRFMHSGSLHLECARQLERKLINC